LSKERRAALEIALRKCGGNCSRAAREAGVCRGTAVTAWPAVKAQMIEQEKLQATHPPPVPVDEAERQRQYTAKMAAAALTRAGNLLHIAGRLEKFGVALVTITEKASVEGVPPADALKLLGAVARFQGKSVDVANAAIAIGKVAPKVDINLELTTMSHEQITKELRSALADLEVAHAQGLDGELPSSPALPASPLPDNTWAPARLPVSAAATTEMSVPLSPLDLPTMRCCGAAIMVRDGATPDPMHIVLVCPSCHRQIGSADGGRSWAPLEKLLPVAATQQGLLN